ncbi:lysophospholipid acyltransferase family protein [Micromonospora zamorensis]|uniref:lysophospholipid acyltransferase family protein n=1 Tax=Micromonospora zamorensis TaxID=709883 RepID=UPI003D98DFF7
MAAVPGRSYRWARGAATGRRAGHCPGVDGRTGGAQLVVPLTVTAGVQQSWSPSAAGRRRGTDRRSAFCVETRRKHAPEGGCQIGPRAVGRALYRPVVEGRGNVPRRRPVIWTAHHLSAIDSIVIPLAAPRPVTLLARAEYFQRPGAAGRLIRAGLIAADAVPVRPGSNQDVQQSLHAALGVLAAPRAFDINPEGTRSRDGACTGAAPG